MNIRESVGNSLTFFGVCLTVCLDIIDPLFGGLWIAFMLSLAACALSITAWVTPPLNRALQQVQPKDEDGIIRHFLGKYWPVAVIGSSIATSLLLGTANYVHSNMEEPGSVTIAAIEKLLDRYHQEQMDVLQTLKKETSDDPAKELANRGVEWNAQSFTAALSEPNFENVILFLKGAQPPLALYQGDVEFCEFLNKLTAPQANEIIDTLHEKGVDFDQKLYEPGWAEEYLLLCSILAERAGLSKKIAQSGANAATITRYVLDTDFDEQIENMRGQASTELTIWKDLIQAKAPVIEEIRALQNEVKSELGEIEQYRSDCLTKIREKAQRECSQNQRTIRVSEYQEKEIDVLRKCSREKSFDTVGCFDSKDRDATNACITKADTNYTNCMSRGSKALEQKYYKSLSSTEVQACVSEELESARCTLRRSIYEKDEDTLRKYYSYLDGIKDQI